jgi:phosphomannomutase
VGSNPAAPTISTIPAGMVGVRPQSAEKRLSLKFGTSGLRGLSTDLTGVASGVYAQAFGQLLLETGAAKGSEIMVGRDFRDSSPEIAATCTAALVKMGFEVSDCGALPTQALALYAMSRKAAAVMITGSHIPADRNGIKFYRAEGEITKSDEAAIAGHAVKLFAAKKKPAFDPATGADKSGEALAHFVARHRGLLPSDALKRLKIGVYQHSTVARDLLVRIVEMFGAVAFPLGRSNTFIPVDTEAVSMDAVSLMRGWTKAYKLDAIISADGDGDRPLVADENGEPLRGDLLGLMTAQFLGAHTVVTPVTSNSGIEAAGEFKVVRTRVGSPFVITGMIDAVKMGDQKVMGFEANGGCLTGTSFERGDMNLASLPTRDCFLPILAMLAIRAGVEKPLSQIASAYSLPVALSGRIENFPIEKSTALMAHLQDGTKNAMEFMWSIGTVSNIDKTDGLRMTLEDGSIIHLRPSGNAPEMRCYVEAVSAGEAKRLMASAMALIASWLPRSAISSGADAPHKAKAQPRSTH